MRRLLAPLVALAALAGAAGLPAAAAAQATDCANPPSTTEIRVLTTPVGAQTVLSAPLGRIEGCDAPEDPIEVTVDWGDGTRSAAAAGPPTGLGGYMAVAAHAYAAAGDVQVRILQRNVTTGVVRTDTHYVARVTPVAAEVLASRGGVTAVLRTQAGSGDEDALRETDGLTLEVLRGGLATRVAAPLSPCRWRCTAEADPADPLPLPGEARPDAGVASVRVADLDGDGEPEVLVDRADGVGVCCTGETAVLRRDPATGRYEELDARLGSSVEVGDDGLLRGDDVRFFTRFTPRVAGVFLPVRVWALRPGELVDVTRQQKPLVRADLKRLQATLRKVNRGRGPSPDVVRKALLPALLAEQRLLGQRAAATRLLATERGAGRITAGYARQVTRFLTRSGY